MVEVVTGDGDRSWAASAGAADDHGGCPDLESVHSRMAEVTHHPADWHSFKRKLDGSIDAGYSYAVSDVAQLNLNCDTVHRTPGSQATA